MRDTNRTGRADAALDGVPMDMPADLMQLRNAGFRRLYETGDPVRIEDVAQVSGLTVEEIEKILSRPYALGRVRRDEQGRIVGIAGLSLEPTAHEVHLDGKRFWTWCAVDAIGIMSALGATGSVLSKPPGSNQTLDIRFVDGQPISNHRVFILGEFDGSDVYGSWCPNVNFFADAGDAHAWADDRGMVGNVAAIDEISEGAGAMWKAAVDQRFQDHAS